VVTDSRDPEESAFWLDDDLPHVRRWAEGKAA
ncbi:M24 family metallopeptidase, partial [Streptomyces sp. 12297]